MLCWSRSRRCDDMVGLHQLPSGSASPKPSFRRLCALLQAQFSTLCWMTTRTKRPWPTISSVRSTSSIRRGSCSSSYSSSCNGRRISFTSSPCLSRVLRLRCVPSLGPWTSTSLVPFRKILGRARHLGGRYASNGSNKADIGFRLQAMAANWSALRGFRFARSPWSHRRLIDLLVTNSGCVDHGRRGIRSIAR